MTNLYDNHFNHSCIVMCLFSFFHENKCHNAKNTQNLNLVNFDEIWAAHILDRLCEIKYYQIIASIILDWLCKDKKCLDSHPQWHHSGAAADGRGCWSLRQQNLEYLCLTAGGAVGVPCMACTGNPRNREIGNEVKMSNNSNWHD